MAHALRRSWMPLDLDQPILAIAASARVLVESGRRGGLSLLAIDQYGDEDTRRAANAVEIAPSPDGGLDPLKVLTAIERVDSKKRSKVVLGGGLDAHPDLIRMISKQRRLLGNSPSLYKELKTPDTCFKLLDTLAIPYPEIRWEYPRDSGPWLIKTGCSEGGKGVRFFSDGAAVSGDYFQRHLAGSTYSVLFLASGDTLRIIGFNTLQTLAVGKTPFLFAGAMNFTDLRRDVLQSVASYALKLVRATGLVGLNSMDFMLDPLKGPMVLEINPRPSATMSLYDRDAALGLLRAHIQAFRGHLMSLSPTTHFRAFHVVLASRELTVSEHRGWPSWGHDRPNVGTTIPSGLPFCTVEAEGSSPKQVLQLLHRRIGLMNDVMAHPMNSSSFSYPV